MSSVLFQQRTPVLSQQQTSVLSQQKTSILPQQKTSAASEAAWRSSTSHPWTPRQRPTWLKRSNLACGGCDSSRLEGGVSCGPPKPGAAYENQPDGAAGGPPGGRQGPTWPRRAHGDAVTCQGGPNINRAPVRDSRATRQVTTCSELRWKAHIFFCAKTDMPPKLPIFLVLLQLAKRLCPFKLYRDSVQGGMVDSKSYCAVVKTHRDETSQVTDLSPG